jgi:hypothetical protein
MASRTALVAGWLVLAQAISPPSRAAETAGKRPDLEREQAAGVVAAAETMRPGRVFRDCQKCPEMAVVPAERFTMGSNEPQLAP